MRYTRIFFLFFIGVYLFLFVVSAADEVGNNSVITGRVITGRATTQSAGITVSVVAVPPSLNLTSPLNKTYLFNTSILLNFSVSGQQAIWYNLDNGANTTIGSYVYFNTSKGSHSLFLYANNSENNITIKNVNFSVNLTQFSVNYSNFNGSNKGNSTDFSQLIFEQLQNISNVVLENTLFGKIEFNGTINLTRDSNDSDGIIDIDRNINISFNRIELNAANLPNFNVSSKLRFFNLTFSDPRILRDGAVCAANECVEESFDDGVLVFNVSHFTVYSAEETPIQQSPGSTGGGSGGGGGSSSSSKEKKEFSVKPEQLKIALKQGETKTRELVIHNTGSSAITLSLRGEGLEHILLIRTSSVTLAPGEEKKIVIDFIARENELPDGHIGKILLSSDSEEKEVLVSVAVSSKSSLFDVALEIPASDQKIPLGKGLPATITIHNLGDSKRVDILIEYVIKDDTGLIVWSFEESKAIDTSLEIQKQFELPETLPLGAYTLSVKVTYEGKTAIASSIFSLVEESYFSRHFLLVGINVFLIVVLIIVLLEFRKNRTSDIGRK